MCALGLYAADEIVGDAAVESKTPVYQGAYIGVDVYEPLSTLWKPGQMQFALSADVSLWHRLFPTVGFGMQFVNKDLANAHYNSNGYFAKLGANYNFINFKNNRQHDHALLLGISYAFAKANYDLTQVKVNDAYWGGTATHSFQASGMTGWVELLFGARAQVYKSFFMGVAVRVQAFSHRLTHEAAYPVYVPGFGVYGKQSVNWNVDYCLYYQIPYKQKKY